MSSGPLISPEPVPMPESSEVPGWDPLDSLPPLPGRPEVNEDIPKGKRQLTFRAHVSGAKYARDGSFVLTLGIPYEDKYRAIPITDMRATLVVVEVYSPAPIEIGADMDHLLEIESVLNPDSVNFVPDNGETVKTSRKYTRGDGGHGEWVDVPLHYGFQTVELEDGERWG